MLRHCYNPQVTSYSYSYTVIHECHACMHVSFYVHTMHEKFYLRGIFWPGGPNVMGVQIFRYKPRLLLVSYKLTPNNLIQSKEIVTPHAVNFVELSRARGTAAVHESISFKCVYFGDSKVFDNSIWKAQG